MSDLTDTAETRALAWLLGQSATAPVPPLKMRLMTANGSDSAAGTEVAGGTYTPQTLSLATAAGGASSNDTVVRFEGIPNPTVVTGVEIWDSAGSPVRWWWKDIADKTVVDGVLEFPIGDVDLTLA